jgi:thiamine biosynthesis lipoprotein
VFSLYRPTSELTALNDRGRLTLPSPDLLALLRLSRWFGANTDGVFDVTVQPLWRVLANHFANASGQEASLVQDLHRARAFVGQEHLLVSDTRIVMPEGFGLTFNGIAQGYITDRVADLLRADGWENVLVNLGETRALDGHAWAVETAATPERLTLRNAAIATSNGDATRFGLNGNWNHLIDPRGATCADGKRVVTVTAARATIADALSTFLAIAGASEFPTISARFPGTRVFVGSGA